MKRVIQIQAQSRRSFMKYSLATLAALVAAPLMKRNSGLAFAEEALTPLSPTDPLATAMGYNPNSAKVDVKKWAKKAGADGKNQKCSSCSLYTSIDGKTGKCQIFQNKTVTSNGWCNSWTKKA